MSYYDVILRPIITEKGVAAKESAATLCFEVKPDVNKTQIKSAVEKLFKVKVAAVRTGITQGKLRRRGKFSGYRSDWKKAWVRLKKGQKMPEFAEV